MDLAAEYVKAFSKCAPVNGLIERANEYEELTGPGSKIESARNDLIESAGHSGIMVLHYEDARKIAAVLKTFGSDLLPDGDVLHVPVQWRLRDGKRFPVWNGRELRVPKSEPKWKPLFAALMDEIKLLRAREEEDHIWGCFLLARCKRLVKIGRPAYDKLAKWFFEDFKPKLEAMQGAASYLASPLMDSEKLRMATSLTSDEDRQDGAEHAEVTPIAECSRDSVTETRNIARSHATLSFAKGKPTICYRKRNCELNSVLEQSMVNFLYECRTNTGSRIEPSYGTVFEAVYGEGTYKTRPDGSPPDKLKQLKSRLNRRLKAALGPSPGDGNWIETNEGYGFHLTNAVDWHAQVGWKLISQGSGTRR